MKTMNNEQKEKLLTAIDLAKNPGKCRYVIDEQPQCVIAQLAVLENVPIGTLKIWDFASNGESGGIGNIDPPELSHYDMGLLENLQDIWDSRDDEPEETKQYMKELII